MQCRHSRSHEFPRTLLTTNGREWTRIKAEHSCLFAVVFRRLWLRLRRAVFLAFFAAQAPADFGPMSNAILISNNISRGRVNAFDPKSGGFLGPLRDANGNPIEIDNVWVAVRSGRRPEWRAQSVVLHRWPERLCQRNLRRHHVRTINSPQDDLETRCRNFFRSAELDRATRLGFTRLTASWRRSTRRSSTGSRSIRPLRYDWNALSPGLYRPNGISCPTIHEFSNCSRLPISRARSTNCCPHRSCRFCHCWRAGTTSLPVSVNVFPSCQASSAALTVPAPQ